MKVHLMFRDQDFDLAKSLPVNEKDLSQDLELNTLFNAMSLGDKVIFESARAALFSSVTDLDVIQYRQEVLRDCIKNSDIVRRIFQIPNEAKESKQRRWLGIFSRSPEGILRSAIELMELYVELLKKLKTVADESSEYFSSEGFRNLFAMIKTELDDEYFSTVQFHLKELGFKKGVLISAELGQGTEAANYILRQPNKRSRLWIKEFFSKRSSTFSFYVDERDDAGIRALSAIREFGVNLVANALAQSADHINSFLSSLQNELAFYVGCINLKEQLDQMGSPITIPEPYPYDGNRYHAAGLYDVCLAITMKKSAVGNTLSADGKNLVMITGANQGGKSTFLRSIGLSQLMMQAGMFVPAQEFTASVCNEVYTHYKRKEDEEMKSGKFEEELDRMSTIIDSIKPRSIILFNESFASTNEREGSEIAKQIVNGLLDRQVKVYFVTHMFELANAFYQTDNENALFLRAERKSGGKRTFKLLEGKPLETSFGLDVYKKVFEQN